MELLSFLQSLLAGVTKAETTPKRLTNEIREFCQRIIGSEDEPHFVAVRAETFAQWGRCHPCCEEMVRRHGGSIVCGWVIWEHEHFLTAEHHACWQSADGEVIDITPKPDGETQILFLPDPSHPYEERRIPNRTFAKTEEGRRFLATFPAWHSLPLNDLPKQQPPSQPSPQKKPHLPPLESKTPKQRAAERRKKRRKC